MTDEESTCIHTNNDPMIDATEKIFFPEQNLQINATIVAFYHLCNENKKIYTGGLTYNNKFYDLMDLTSIQVEGFTVTTEEGSYYNISETITDSTTYDMVKGCSFEGDSILVTKLLKLNNLNQVAVQELEDRYRVVFNFNNDNNLNAAYIRAIVKYDGELKECILIRDKNQIGHYESYDFIEISKEHIELIEIRSVKLSVWNCEEVSSLTTYDTIYSLSNPRTLKIEQFHEETVNTIWNQSTGEMITDIPTEVPGFNNQLPNDLGNEETKPDDSNNNTDVDVDNNNDNTNNGDDNQDDENTKLDQALSITITVAITILLIFLLYKAFCFIKKFVN